MDCSIVGCAICSNTTCTSCLQGYTLRNGTCNPVCDRYCDLCTTPNNCGLCKLNYIFDDTIKACKLDCSTGFGGNCAECSSLLFCSRCKDGYVSYFEGAACMKNNVCSDTNCKECTTNTTNATASSQCISCKTGYKLTNGTCEKDICNIANCQSCKTVSACDVCLANYLVDNTTGLCQPSCLSTQPNCLVCTNNTLCSICAVGYVLYSNNCSKACTIDNCDVCAS